MINNIVIANIICLIAGIFSIVATQGKNKKQIVFIEFITSVMRIISNFILKNWTNFIAKIIKAIAQFLTIKKRINKGIIILLSFAYLCISLLVIYISKDLRCLVAIVPSLMEFYALLGNSTKKYRSYIIITKILWTINNIIFKLYAGIFIDAIVVLGHLIRMKRTRKR